MDTVTFKKGSQMKKIIHQGLKKLGYEIIYQDIVHHRIMIYRNRQIHMAMIYDAGTNEESFILVDYYKTAETRKIAQPFLDLKDAEMQHVGATILNLKSIL